MALAGKYARVRIVFYSVALSSALALIVYLVMSIGREFFGIRPLLKSLAAIALSMWMLFGLQTIALFLPKRFYFEIPILAPLSHVEWWRWRYLELVLFLSAYMVGVITAHAVAVGDVELTKAHCEKLADALDAYRRERSGAYPRTLPLAGEMPQIPSHCLKVRYYCLNDGGAFRLSFFDPLMEWPNLYVYLSETQHWEKSYIGDYDYVRR